MKPLKLFFTPILLVLFFSSVSIADIRLVGDDQEPGVAVIGSRLTLNTQYSGLFILSKNSHINDISASIRGTGSLLVSIYSNSELTNLPSNLIYNTVVDITSSTFNGLTNFQIAPIQLEKGMYWIVMEPVTAMEDSIIYYNSAFEALTKYSYNFNYAGWLPTEHQIFSLVINGHPTGRLTKK